MNCFMCFGVLWIKITSLSHHHHTATLWRNIHPLIFNVVRGLWPLEKKIDARGKRVGVVLSGGNVDVKAMVALL